MRVGIIFSVLLFFGIFSVGVLSNSSVNAQSDAFFEFSTSKSVYYTQSPEFITISVKVSSELYRERSSAIIDVIYPNGDEEEHKAYVLENGIFSIQVRTNSEMQLGKYTLQAHYMNKDSQKITLEIRDAPKPKSQTALILIEKILKKNNRDTTELDEILVNTGPGSFTGTRVGVAIANALGFALGMKINGSKLKHAFPKYE